MLVSYSDLKGLVLEALRMVSQGQFQYFTLIDLDELEIKSLILFAQGIVTGVFRSLGALGRAAGPIFGSFLYWSLGPELSYAIGGFGLLIPYFMLRRLS